MNKDKEPGIEKEKSSLSRIILENNDGTVRYLDGEEAGRWDEVMDTLAGLGYVYHIGQEELASLNWKEADSLQDLLSSGLHPAED